MSSEDLIRMTITRYYKPSEVPWDYDELIESAQRDNGNYSLEANKQWLDERPIMCASYDNTMLLEGRENLKERLELGEQEHTDAIEYKFEVVRFTNDENGWSETVIHTIEDCDPFDLGGIDAKDLPE